MKKLFLGLLFAGFCLPIIGSEFDSNNKRLSSKLSGHIIKNADVRPQFEAILNPFQLGTSFNWEKTNVQSLQNDGKYWNYTVQELHNTSPVFYTYSLGKDITIKAKRSTTNNVQQSISVDTFLCIQNTNTPNTEIQLKTTDIRNLAHLNNEMLQSKKFAHLYPALILDNFVKKTALLSGATLLASCFCNFSNKARSALFIGSLGLGWYRYNSTKEKMYKKNLKKCAEDEKKIEEQKTEIKKWYNENNQLSGWYLLNKILHSPIAPLTDSESQYSCNADNAFDKITNENKAVNNDDFSKKSFLNFLTNSISFKIPTNDNRNYNPLYNNGLKSTIDVNKTIRMFYENCRNSSFLLGSVITAWTIDFTTGALRNNFPTLIFKK